MVKERWIDFVKFGIISRLGSKINTTKLHVSDNRKRVCYDDKTYDITFDATCGNSTTMKDTIFEVCLPLVYKRLDDSDKKSPAVTVVDEECFSFFFKC